MKTTLALTTIPAILILGCEAQTSRSFSHTTEDGSYVTIDIDYKPKSRIEGDKKFGSYYYIAQLLNSSFDPKIHSLSVEIAFYDEKGYSLFKSSTSSSNFLYLSNTVHGERNPIDGGYEWKGQFYEKDITFERFGDTHFIKAKVDIRRKF